MNISMRIKELRNDLGLTQEELAVKLGLKGKSSIANYEAGKISPSDEIKLKMCKIFNCSMDYLMGTSNFKNKDLELDNFLNNDIKESLIKDLKALELDKVDIEKAITAFFENYIVISDNPTIDIYKMENSLVYYAYETITKYFFKLVNKELTLMIDNSISFSDAMQQYFEKAELSAWNKMKEILENIFDFDVVSDLTVDEKVEKIIGNLNISNQYYMCPVYGQISAGIPNWVEECIEGRIPIDPVLFDIVNPEEHFFLRVNGESMNKLVRNGAYALIHKQDTVENGEIAVVLVNGDEATLKKFTKQNDMVILEPMSNDSNFTVQIYDKNTPIKILGKYIGKFEMNK